MRIPEVRHSLWYWKDLMNSRPCYDQFIVRALLKHGSASVFMTDTVNGIVEDSSFITTPQAVEISFPLSKFMSHCQISLNSKFNRLFIILTFFPPHNISRFHFQEAILSRIMFSFQEYEIQSLPVFFVHKVSNELQLAHCDGNLFCTAVTFKHYHNDNWNETITHRPTCNDMSRLEMNILLLLTRIVSLIGLLFTY